MREGRSRQRARKAPGKPFTCPVCDRAFTRKWNLEEHIRGLHPASGDGKRFPCPVCRERFRWKIELRNHVKAEHPREYENLKTMEKLLKNMPSPR
mmetsp:Transcript_26291/g.102734  ORF Transcript_26291/g.102734 Transcript_26291/m.102734 type:complete len:95 (-) Transcript_26291:311-595(-)